MRLTHRLLQNATQTPPLQKQKSMFYLGMDMYTIIKADYRPFLHLIFTITVIYTIQCVVFLDAISISTAAAPATTNTLTSNTHTKPITTTTIIATGVGSGGGGGGGGKGGMCPAPTFLIGGQWYVCAPPPPPPTHTHF